MTDYEINRTAAEARELPMYHVSGLARAKYWDVPSVCLDEADQSCWIGTDGKAWTTPFAPASNLNQAWELLWALHAKGHITGVQLCGDAAALHAPSSSEPFVVGEPMSYLDTPAKAARALTLACLKAVGAIP